MTVWFTADQHYGHNNIIKYTNRPFASLEEMNEALLARHNEKVQDGDTVYHLGDFSLGPKWVELYAPKLKGENILISGNHDRTHPIHKGHAGLTLRYLESGFRVIYTREFSTYFDGLGQTRMCHFPYVGDVQHEERYKELRPIRGLENILLHGHIHDRWKSRDNMINVGVDVWNWYPVSLEQLTAFKKEQS